MPEFAPVTLLDVHLLDDEEAAAGYHAGANGSPEPVASFFSRSFLFGWRNGAADAGLIEPTDDQRLLAHSVRLGEAATARAWPGEPAGFRFPWH